MIAFFSHAVSGIERHTSKREAGRRSHGDRRFHQGPLSRPIVVDFRLLVKCLQGGLATGCRGVRADLTTAGDGAIRLLCRQWDKRARGAVVRVDRWRGDFPAGGGHDRLRASPSVAGTLLSYRSVDPNGSNRTLAVIERRHHEQQITLLQALRYPAACGASILWAVWASGPNGAEGTAPAALLVKPASAAAEPGTSFAASGSCRLRRTDPGDRSGREARGYAGHASGQLHHDRDAIAPRLRPC